MDAPPVIQSPQQAITHRGLAPQDIVFRLAVLAAFNIELFWFPIYYFTTYDPGNDDRGGLALLYALGFCPVSWILAWIWYAQVWHGGLAVRSRLMFRITCTILVMIVFSTLVAFGYGIVRIIFGIAHKMR